MKYCSSCSTPNPDEFQECGACGTPLPLEAGGPVADVVVPKSRGGLVVAIVVGLCLIVGGAFFAWTWYQDQQAKDTMLGFARPYVDSRASFVEFWGCIAPDKGFDEISAANVLVLLGKTHPPSDKWDNGISDAEKELFDGYARCRTKLEAHATTLGDVKPPPELEDNFEEYAAAADGVAASFKEWAAVMKTIDGKRKLSGTVKAEALNWLAFATKGEKAKKGSAVRYLSFLECTLEEPLTEDLIMTAHEILRDRCEERGVDWVEEVRERCADTFKLAGDAAVSDSIAASIKATLWENTHTLEITSCFQEADKTRTRAAESALADALATWRNMDNALTVAYQAEIGAPGTWDD